MKQPVIKNLMHASKVESKNYLGFVITCILAVIWVIVFTFVNARYFFYVEVEGNSMAHTLESGDVLCVNRYIAPEYYDIVVIDGEKVEGGQSYLIIKRVIGLEGDVIKFENNHVYRNGVLVDDKWTASSTKEFIVPEGEIFYLGDNRMVSKDSRSEFGTCKVSQVKGVVTEVALALRPLEKIRIDISSFVKEILTFGK